jgi:creatinine amidohydrolase
MDDLAKLTSPIERFFQPRSLALVPVGSTEPHGPHLPLDTDVTIDAGAGARAARASWARWASRPRALCRRSPTASRTTPAASAGRRRSGPDAVGAARGPVLALEQEGVRQIVLGQRAPRARARPGAARRDARPPQRAPGRGRCFFADNTRRKQAERLGAEFQSGDCHAGSYETSLVLAAEPESVRRERLAELAPVRIDLIEKMKAGVTTFAAAGAARGYCGDPRQATRGRGHELAETPGRDGDRAPRARSWPELVHARDGAMSTFSTVIQVRFASRRSGRRGVLPAHLRLRARRVRGTWEQHVGDAYYRILCDQHIRFPLAHKRGRLSATRCASATGRSCA